MARRYDHNDPFTREDDEVNPFSNPRNLHKVSSAGLSSLPPEPADFYGHRGAPIDIPLDRAVDLKQKERELRAKEIELNKREEIVKRKEEALAKAGVTLQEKNWPPFFPIIHQDISNEIPAYLQRVQYVAFATFLGVPLSLLWNFIAMTAQFAKGGDGRIFFLSIIYFILGVPGAYFLWYRPLYRAMKTDSALRFGWFFIFYMVHIIFFVYAAIAPPIIFNGLYFTGAFTAVQQMTNSVMIGILYFIGFGLFVIESVVSIWVFQRVYRYFRGSGKAAEVKRGTAALAAAI